MALLEGPKRCGLGHFPCTLHGEDKPDLASMPGLDRQPRIGPCIAGHPAVRVWVVPLDGHGYCIRHLRMVLRVATYPNALRFPDDANGG